MKVWKKALISFSILIIGMIVFFGYGLYLMSIEDRYGDLQEIYYDADDGDLVIIDQKEAGFIRKYDSDIFVEQGECLRHLLNFRDKKVEVYEVDIEETYVDFTIENAEALKNKPSSELIYKNF